MTMLALLVACRAPYEAPSSDSGGDLDCTPATWYADADGDSFGDAAVSQIACDAPTGWASNAADCDDAAVTVHPSATELCNGVDDDCDGAIDEDVPEAFTWYADADGDSFGDPTVSQIACDAPPGYVADASDCDDGDADVRPNGAEVPDTLVDEDCDGRVDELRVCQDGTGEFEWINDAIEAAPVDGALIEVCTGTYSERITSSLERAIEIIGETGVAADVIVDGSSLGMAVDLGAPRDTAWDSAVTLRGMTFVGGAEGGVRVGGWGTVVMSDFVITGATGGYPLYVYAQVASFSDCEVFGNDADWLAILQVYYPDAMTRCYVHDNIALAGMAMMAMPVYNSIFYRNQIVEGGLIRPQIQGDGGSLLENSTFVENIGEVTVQFYLYSDEYPEHEVRNNLFCRNVGDAIGWLPSLCCHDYDDDLACSDWELEEGCEDPVVEYNWTCEAAAEACQTQWCVSVLGGRTNTVGISLALSSESVPPFALGTDSPAVDRGDPEEQFDDADGTPNDPGRYGGPSAYP